MHRRIVSLISSPNLFHSELSRAQTYEIGHGRIETRRIVVCECPHGYLAMPSVHQVFCLSRERINKATGEVQSDVEYGLTSLSSTKIGATGLLSLVRDHWTIENRSHYVRDVTFGEDRCRARCRNLPSVLSLLRGAALNLLRGEGTTNVAAALRRFAARPQEAIQLLKKKTE